MRLNKTTNASVGNSYRKNVEWRVNRKTNERFIWTAGGVQIDDFHSSEP